MADPRQFKRDFLAACLLALVTLAAFWPVGHHEFVNFDDPDYVTSNPMVQQGLTWRGVAWAFTTSHTGNWHPLTWLSHMLDCQWFGVHAAAHHYANVVIHVLNSVLLLLALYRMTRQWESSVIVAALFALHPLHVESVAWVSERKDLLSACFWMLALWAYACYAARPHPARYLGVAASFALGLMAKPMVVTLPFVLLLLDLWPLGRWRSGGARVPWADSSSPVPFPARSLPQLLLEKVPLLALSALSSVVTYLCQAKVGAVESLEYLSAGARLSNALVAYARYLGKAFWPADLTALYPLPEAWPAWAVAGAVVLLLAGLVVAVLQIKRRPYLLVGWLWFLGTLVPVIGLVQVGSQSMADRYTYLPLIGLFIAVTWYVGELTESRPSRRLVAGLLAAVLLLACLVATRHQVQYWRNNVTLYERMLRVTGDNPKARFNLAVSLKAIGSLDQAMTHFRETFRLNPNLFLKYAQIRPEDPGQQYSLGVILLSLDRPQDALTNFAAAASLAPTNAQAFLMWGRALMALGRSGEATPRLSEALRLAPDNHEARLQMALALDFQHRDAEAVPLYREVLRANPHQLDALKNLAWILATHAGADLRNGPEAMTLGKRLCELTANTNALALGTLAAAYAEEGQFPDAISAAQTALDLATRAGQTSAAGALQRHLQRYQAHQPWREGP